MAKRRQGTRREQEKTEREEAWRQIMAEQRGSGVTHSEFCRWKGISPNSYFWWKRELQVREAKRGRGARSAKPEPRRRRRGRSPLVAVTIREPEASPRPFEVVLFNRRVVRVPAEFDAESLKRLLTVLEDGAC